ncbi:beta-ketoacyl synthase domain-containing protein [Xylariaceae sp. FL1651]|nr:beta-ketoacyl synthase domain-containing protein [Xylariaceae sp. FL1651]
MERMITPPEPIAIVGSSCRFAGHVTSPSKLWDVLCQTPDLSRQVPTERFNSVAFYHEDGEYHGTTNSTKAYWLDQDPHAFDAGFFSITPKEAEAMDPQQRLLLEVVFEAMESAGFSLGQYSGKEVGVFSGYELSTSQYFPTGNSRAIMSNRISYFFNFQGPSMTIDTACSSSLVALHQAMLSLRSGGCIMACVTGANLMLTPEQFICHMWDARADGYARGEGLATVLLKSLSQALADGDEIEAVIREVGINADGRTSGITMPNPAAQASLIRKTYQRAGLDPRNPSDRSGDPREAEAIHKAFFASSNSSRDEMGFSTPSGKMLVGSVKTVIGHTEAAAGLAGILKTVAGMKHGLIPPNLHFETLNPQVRPYYKRVQIPTAIVPWPDPPPGQPRRASVNSFGFGGANAHAIVESYTPQIHDAFIRSGCSFSASRSETPDVPGPLIQTPLEEATGPLFLPLFISAASQKSLRDVAQSYRTYLAQSQVDVQQLSWHQYLRRTALPYRVALSAASTSQALEILDSLLLLDKSIIPSSHAVRIKASNSPLRILGVFTGQGAQWPTMSVSLFRQNTVYRGTIRRLDAVLKDCPYPPSWTLEEQIMADKDASRIQEAAVSQPLCTALQIALTDLMQSIEIVFHTVVGHSSGEIAAAYAAGKLSAEDAIIVSYFRGMVASLARGLGGQKGGMLAAGMTESEALSFCRDPLFDGRICLAANNSPTNVTLSGDLDAIDLAHKRLDEDGKFSRVLHVDTAYHSHHMTKSARDYVVAMREYGISPLLEGNTTIWISSVEGRPRTDARDLDCHYWVDNMAYRVQFRGALEYAISQAGGFDCAIEIGPHPALQSPTTQIAKALGYNIPYCCPLNRTKDGGQSVSDFLGFIWSNFGPLNIDLRSYIEQSPMRNLVQSRCKNLPSYPFDHSTGYWRESRISQQYHFRTNAPHELLGVRSREDNKYELRWRNILKLEKIPWLEHHKFQGQALVPASAYCIMALDAARYLLDGQSASLVELRNVHIHSGITVDRGSPGVETLFSLIVTTSTSDSTVIGASFSLYSCPVNNTAKMKKDVTGSLQIVLSSPFMGVLPPRRPRLSETLLTDPEAFYKMMDLTGLVYTGPFRALTSIQRRYSYCSATVKRFHSDDTTTLAISPATLDACFQSAFLSYASPNDGSLWTTFLPTKIDRVLFNLAALPANSGANNETTLIVDTHTTRRLPPVQASKATIAVDASIFNERGEAEIQVEGLAVRALANTQPEDDYELYLNTVMDIDPTDEIVPIEHTVSDGEGSLLAENCAKISSFYRDSHDFWARQPQNTTKHHRNLTLKGWPSETPGDIDNLIRNSNHTSYLESIRSVGELDPNRLTVALPFITEEARHVAHFRNHVGRIVKQITHSYPWMRILYLTTPEVELTKPILAAIERSFQSFTIGFSQGASPSISEHTVSPSIENVQMRVIDPKEELHGQIGSNGLMDLVLLSAALLKSDDSKKILKNISEVMKPEAFLILVDPYSTRFGDRTGVTSYGSSSRPPPTPPYWLDILDVYGFVQQARNSDQFHQAGHVIVRQFLGKMLTTPTLRRNVTTETLLLVRDTSETNDHQLITDLHHELSPYCNHIISCSLDDASAQELENCTAVVVLVDLYQPLMLNMTGHKISQLSTLLRPSLTVLWVTCDARSGDPGRAASFGFLRTISAEVPTLRLQVLDLEPGHVKSRAQIISSIFLRLASANTDASNNSLGTLEPEIHMENGRRLIPRVVPLKHANDRVNALRRVVARPINTLQDRAEVTTNLTSNGSLRFEVKETEQSVREVPKDSVLIQVEYSSALPFKFNDGVSAYRMAALSSINSSYITCPPPQTFMLQHNTSPSLMVLHQLLRWVAALSSAWASPKNYQIFLIDPDIEFARCLVDIAARSGPLSRRIAILGTSRGEEDTLRYTSIKAGELGHYAPFCLHPRISVRELNQILGKDAMVFNFLPETDELSQRIADALPSSSSCCSGFTMFGSEILMREADLPRIKSAWRVATLLTMQKISSASQKTEDMRTVSLNEVQSQSGRVEPFQIIDWKRDRDTLLAVGHISDKQLIYPNKTYFLFGMTRDFGHSLCCFFLEHGARNIVLASRNPNTSPQWLEELRQSYAADIRIEKADVTKLESLVGLKRKLAEAMPPVGGVINGAMVLDDRVFAQMTIDTWNRVLLPKTVGSMNLDTVFSEPNLDFFIMTSSFAAIGGHPGQSNYAAANMYMNGLAANRRRRGLAGSVLNIGVIYGLGFLQREKDFLYAGLERDGYPPVSEHDLHHMFLEAIVAGRPNAPGQPFDITTGLSRFRRGTANPLHWHLDPRFGHFATQTGTDSSSSTSEKQKSLEDELAELTGKETMADAICAALEDRLCMLLQLPEGVVDRHNSLADMGIDSLIAVEVRNWFYKTLGKDVSVMKVLGAASIYALCIELAEEILLNRVAAEGAGSLRE